FGDKLPADKRPQIEDALAKLKAAHSAQDIDGIDKATAELNTVFQAASEEMYRQGQQAGPQPGADQPGPGADAGAGASSGKDSEVTDVDFEEVK
ncbi:MAG: molecular chaperone DnaK, partial [Bacteroidales bacterium]|nr:molecular chaperone DnaK [Bacteroidales bacterium]